jgi:DNA-binding HxlR family transcriptional regulator
MNKNRSKRSNCPINFALESFGDMWSLLIVRDMLGRHKSTYGEFLASDEKISTNILADRLSRLEKKGIIEKKPHASDRRKDTYQLTRKGTDLAPMLLEMVLWSAKYDPNTPVTKEFVERAKKNSPRFVLDKMKGGEGSDFEEK